MPTQRNRILLSFFVVLFVQSKYCSRYWRSDLFFDSRIIIVIISGRSEVRTRFAQVHTMKIELLTIIRVALCTFQLVSVPFNTLMSWMRCDEVDVVASSRSIDSIPIKRPRTYSLELNARVFLCPCIHLESEWEFCTQNYATMSKYELKEKVITITFNSI